MNKFLRKNNKKLLAFASVFLMISFLATTRYSGSNSNRGTRAIGYIRENEPVLEGEVDRARQEWRLLTQAIMVQYPAGEKGEMQWVPLLALPQFSFLRPLANEPKLFLLLQKEAD